jgi:hypothetical protein
MADVAEPKARKAASDAGAAPRKKAKVSDEIDTDQSKSESDDTVVPTVARASRGKGRVDSTIEP